MQLYSEYPVVRTRQIVADVAAVALIVLIISTALAIAAAIREFAQLGANLEDAGASWQSGLADAADELGSIPLIGSGIRGPLDAAAGAGGAVVDAGRGFQELVEQVAVGAAWAAALIPLILLALAWLLPRVLFARRATTTRRLLAAGMTEETLAARAVARQPLRRLATVHPDPGAAVRAGDAGVIRALGVLELRRAGIRETALP